MEPKELLNFLLRFRIKFLEILNTIEPSIDVEKQKELNKVVKESEDWIIYISEALDIAEERKLREDSHDLFK